MSAETADRAGDDEVDPSAPVFFMSYAHAPDRQRGQLQDQNKLFMDFFDELSANVAELVSLPPGTEPGYVDRSLDAGDHWTDELLQALGTCQVFVALLSARYFGSAWCSKEWYAFSQRNAVSKAKQKNNKTNIAPVIWAGPVHDDQVPAAIGRIQRFRPIQLFEPAIAEHYSREGLYGLRKTNHVAYQTVVWKLAQHIAQVQYEHRLKPLILKEDELQDIFGEQ
jgi:hypothetical protein